MKNIRNKAFALLLSVAVLFGTTPAAAQTATAASGSETGPSSGAQLPSGDSAASKTQSAPAVTVKITAAGGESIPPGGYRYAVGDRATALKAVAECRDDKGAPITGGKWEYDWWRNGIYASDKAECVPSTNKAGTSKYCCDVAYTLNGREYDAETDEVSVTVFAASAAKPKIYDQPSGGTYQAGAKHILPLNIYAWASDGGTLSYQWYVSRDNENFSKIDGGSVDENDIGHYTPASSSKAAVYYYYCVVTNTQPSITGGTSTATARSDTATVTFKGVADGIWKGEGTESSPFLLSSADDLKKLAEEVNTDGLPFDGSYFKFTKNITLPENWTPVGALKSGESDPWSGRNILPFSGTIDGGGHTLTVPNGGKPLLGYVRYAAVKNLNLYGAEIDGYGLVDDYCVDYGPTGDYSDWTAGAAYPKMPMTVTIDNVTLKSGTRTLKSGLIGGYASGADTVQISNSTVENGVTIGYDGQQSDIGSFAGAFNGTLENCVSSATVKGENSVGGLVGSKGQSMGNCSVWDSAFHGTVSASGSYAGGLIGSGYSAISAPNTPCVTIQNCCSDSTVTGEDDVGGLLGGEPSCRECWANGIGYIQNNYFTGKVSAAGGAGGTAAPAGQIQESKAFALGKDGAAADDEGTGAGAAHVGGIIGSLKSLDRYNVISNNYYLDTSTKAGIGSVDSVETAPQKSKASSQFKTLFTSLAGKIMRSFGGPADSSERYGRSDDPTGADAGGLTKAVTKTQFTDGSVLAKLNSGVNSSGTWVAGKNGYPALNRRQKHMVSLAVASYPSRCEGGASLSGLSADAAYSDGSFKSISQSDLRLSRFDSNTEGYDTVTAKYGNHASIFEVEITSDAENPSPDSDKINVSFRLIGATKSNGAVDLKTGNYRGSKYATWIPEKSYALTSGSKVSDLFHQALREAGLKSAGSGSDYVSTIYAPEKYGGYKLSALSNGPYSGWMYTINGSHPSDSLKDVTLEDGDEVVWHYVDDYRYEVEDWFSDPAHPRLGDGTYYNEWLKEEDAPQNHNSPEPEKTAAKSTVTTASDPNGGTISTVATQPDAAPTVSGNRSDLSVTVPPSITSVISAATAERPAKIKIAAPASAMVAQLGNRAAQTVALTAKVPGPAANNTNANVTIEISLDPSVLQAAKSANKTVIIRVVSADTGKEAYSWTFTGSSLANAAARITETDLALSVEPASSDPAAAAVTAANTAGKKASGVVLRFGDNGLLPAAPAAVRIYVGDQPGCAPNSKVYSYYLDQHAKTLEQIPASERTVGADGYVTLAISHCSEYVLLPQPATDPYPVKSDTTYALRVKNGRSYTFAMTAGGKSAPVFRVGNGKAFAASVKHDGNKYYFTVRAVGKAGTMTAVYSTLPKQAPVVLCYLAAA